MTRPEFVPERVLAITLKGLREGFKWASRSARCCPPMMITANLALDVIEHAANLVLVVVHDEGTRARFDVGAIHDEVAELSGLDNTC